MTTYPIKIQPGLNNLQGETYTTIIRALSSQANRDLLSTSSIIDLVNNSGGVVSGTNTVTAATTVFADTPASGSNLASKATIEAALVTVQDAIAELYAKANVYVAKLGLAQITYNGGGAAPDGTVAVITVATTGATTGPTAANLALAIASLNNALYNVTVLSNKVAASLGKTKLTVTPGTTAAAIAALTVTTGTAAGTGVTKVAADAALVQLANNVATIAAHLNAHNDGVGTAMVVAL